MKGAAEVMTETCSQQRINALKSTGPLDTTKTRLNASKHGLYGSQSRNLDSQEAREMEELIEAMAKYWNADRDDPETSLRLRSASFHVLKLEKAYPRLLRDSEPATSLLGLRTPEGKIESQMTLLKMLIRHENAAMSAMEWIRNHKESVE